MFSNLLTDGELERLAFLQEEMGEATQIIGKILRHGYESVNPDQKMSPTNRARLQAELGDVLCCIYLLNVSGDLAFEGLLSASDSKLKRLRAWSHHQDGVL